MHLKIAPGIILFVAALIFAMKLINIDMRLLMVSQYPFLSKLRFASWECAHEFLQIGFIVRSQMVDQMLGHFE